MYILLNKKLNEKHFIKSQNNQQKMDQLYILFPCAFKPAKLFQKDKPVRLTQALCTAKSLAGDLVCFYGAEIQN